MKRSTSYDESTFDIVTSNIQPPEYITTPDITVRPSDIWSSDDDDDDSEFTYYFGMDNLVEYTYCGVCNKKVIVDEEAGFHPNFGVVICYPYNKNGCQALLKDVHQHSIDVQKTIIFRESICIRKPTKRRYGLVWGRNTTVK